MTDRGAFASCSDAARTPSVAHAATDPERARIAEGTADQPGSWWAFGPYDPAWHDELLFHEYFHGETGEGLGASHQMAGPR
jgi:hypothetical protein